MSAMSTTQPAPRRRATFVDPSSPVFWVMTALVGIGTAILVAQNGEALVEDPVATLMAAAAWVAYGAIAIAIIVVLQRYGRRPAVTVLAALAWGGLAATAFSSLGNAALDELAAKILGTDIADAVTASVGAPLVEETLKVAGIVGLALIPGVRMRGPLDGLFWGLLVGAGFQVVEDFFYTMSFMASASGPTEAIASMMFIRGFLSGLFTHAVFGAIEGAAVGYAVSRRHLPLWRRWLVVLAAIVFVMVIHGAQNAQSEGTWLVFAIGAVPLVTALVLLVWARRDEARRLAGLAPVAVERGLMTTDEAEALRADRRPSGDREAKRRRLAQLRYLEAVDVDGAGSARAEALAAGIAGSTTAA